MKLNSVIVRNSIHVSFIQRESQYNHKIIIITIISKFSHSLFFSSMIQILKYQNFTTENNKIYEIIKYINFIKHKIDLTLLKNLSCLGWTLTILQILWKAKKNDEVNHKDRIVKLHDFQSNSPDDWHSSHLIIFESYLEREDSISSFSRWNSLPM